MIGLEKKDLRTKMFDLRKSLPEEERLRQSNLVNELLIELIEKEVIKTVHSFLPMGNEVDIHRFLRICIEKNIAVACPKTLKKPVMINYVLESLENVAEGVFGTKYPASGVESKESSYDLIIVPGLAFDKNGGRLGYGGGYYDNFLKGQEGSLKVGVCYNEQVVPQVPMEVHDVRLNQLVTPSQREEISLKQFN